MTTRETVGDIEIDRDLDFQHRQWTVQRAGWLVMLVILLAALIGLFGAGPLSSATVEAGSLQLQYSRFERRHAPTGLELTVASTAVNQDQVEIWISIDFLQGTEITSIVPEPEEVSETDDRVVYRFSIDDRTRTPTIRFSLEYDEPGVTTGRIGMNDGPELTFWQFVYP